jgi:hypothetical protein
MLIEFELKDILELVDEYWNVVEDQNRYFVFEPNSLTSLFLIKKILCSFGYECNEFDFNDRDLYITTLLYNDIVVTCSSCNDNFCNRLFPYDGNSSNPEDDQDDNQNN